MSIIRSPWIAIPVTVRAVGAGFVFAAAGAAPWAALASLNMRFWPEAPWAVVPTALYLWLFWLFATGRGWPRATQAERRSTSRAVPISGALWGASLLAGGLGFFALVLGMRVFNRLAALPAQRTDDLLSYPLHSVLAWLVTSAIVAGVVEEISFRGYMQTPIERRHGPVIAILITGSAFGLLHFTHPEVTLALMPYYLAVAAIYGAIAHLSRSILPCIVLHVVGNMLSSLGLLARGRSEWQAGPRPEALIWETGADASFWLSTGAAGMGAVFAVVGFFALAETAKREFSKPPSSSANAASAPSAG